MIILDCAKVSFGDQCFCFAQLRVFTRPAIRSILGSENLGLEYAYPM